MENIYLYYSFCHVTMMYGAYSNVIPKAIERGYKSTTGVTTLEAVVSPTATTSINWWFYIFLQALRCPPWFEPRDNAFRRMSFIFLWAMQYGRGGVRLFDRSICNIKMYLLTPRRVGVEYTTSRWSIYSSAPLFSPNTSQGVHRSGRGGLHRDLLHL